MDNTERSKFNMGLAMLARIDSLITEAVVAKKNYDYRSWFNNLLALAGEINFTFKGEVLETDLEYQNIISGLLNRKSNKEILYSCLISYEKFIKQQLSERDMLIATKEDVRKAVLNF